MGAAANVADRPVGRLRADMSEVLVQESMIASTALFMKHVEMGEGSPGEVACTDGVRVRIWNRFHAYRPEQRCGILLHEYLHAAFAHPLRALKLRRRLGASYRHDVLNVAADAIINEGIRLSANHKIGLPDDGVSLSKLAEAARAIVQLTGVKVDHQRMGNVAKLTLEWLYDALIRLKQAAEEYNERGCQDDPSSDETPNGGTDGAQSAGSNPVDQARAKWMKEANEKALREFLNQMNTPADIDLDGIEGMSPLQVDDAIRNAGEKLRNAAAMGKGHGRARGSWIEKLAADIPQVKTPWEHSFRSITQRHLARSRERRPSKPGRRVLTQEAMQVRNIVWSAGRRRPPVPRVVVVLDSSGSILPAEYIRYLAEIQAMKRRTNAQVFAIVADAEVQSVQEIKDVRAVADVEFKGRGGTDFRPALALAEEMEADLVVYLTDLMGTYPAEVPACPVLWTLTSREIPSGYEPPFGRVLQLD